MFCGERERVFKKIGFSAPFLPYSPTFSYLLFFILVAYAPFVPSVFFRTCTFPVSAAFSLTHALVYAFFRLRFSTPSRFPRPVSLFRFSSNPFRVLVFSACIFFPTFPVFLPPSHPPLPSRGITAFIFRGKGCVRRRNGLSSFAYGIFIAIKRTKGKGGRIYCRVQLARGTSRKFSKRITDSEK